MVRLDLLPGQVSEGGVEASVIVGVLGILRKGGEETGRGGGSPRRARRRPTSSLAQRQGNPSGESVDSHSAVAV